MPLKLKDPRPGRTPFYSVRGTHLGIYIDQSTGFTEKSKAAAVLREIRDDIERNRLARPGEPVFLDAIVRYIEAGGDNRFLGSINDETGEWSGIAGRLGALPLTAITQAVIDETAAALLPKGTPATRNRQVYTPISAVLKQVGIETQLKRPKGWRGQRRTLFMTKDQVFDLLEAAEMIDPEFAIFLTLLVYTGMRLSEALGLTCDRVSLAEAWAYLPKTKNSDPRMVYLPRTVKIALANHPGGLDRGQLRVFRFGKNGRLYNLIKLVRKKAGAELSFVTFHICRHTWATWMRRYGGLDTSGLVETGAWRDRTSAARYEHLDITEESRKADLLPEPPAKRGAKQNAS